MSDKGFRTMIFWVDFSPSAPLNKTLRFLAGFCYFRTFITNFICTTCGTLYYAEGDQPPAGINPAARQSVSYSFINRSSDSNGRQEISPCT